MYSDFSQVDDDLSPNDERFNPANGWVYWAEVHGGRTYLALSFDGAVSHNVGYIWYAPKHVRAFSTAAYHPRRGI